MTYISDIQELDDGCASGDTGTLYAIESVLKQKVDENIRVLPI